MKYTTLGKSGLIVSNICLGTMAFGRWIDEQASLRIVDEALDLSLIHILRQSPHPGSSDF